VRCMRDDSNHVDGGGSGGPGALESPSSECKPKLDVEDDSPLVGKDNERGPTYKFRVRKRVKYAVLPPLEDLRTPLPCGDGVRAALSSICPRSRAVSAEVRPARSSRAGWATT
jgi:hypothetical protein